MKQKIGGELVSVLEQFRNIKNELRNNYQANRACRQTGISGVKLATT